MPDKEKEIHKTEFVDKGALPEIFIKKQIMTSLTDKKELIIQVSDKTSKKALETLEKVKEIIEF